MLDGTKLRLREPIVAIEVTPDRARPLTIPAGAIVEVVSAHSKSGLLANVLWEGLTVTILSADVGV